MRTMIVAYRNSGAGPVIQRGHHHRRCRERSRQAAWMNDTRGGDREYPAAAGREHYRRCGSHQSLASAACRRRCPHSISVKILTDRTTTIRASVADVQFEFMLTVGLVVMVIFLVFAQPLRHHYSQHGRSALLGGHVRGHVFAGYSLNNLSLMASDHFHRLRGGRRHRDDRKHLALSRGRHRPLQAALMGSEQIGFTIVSLTVSLIAVLIPLLFMGDIVGRLFREFAVTLAVTILVSAVVSLTLTPMMCAKILKHKPASQQGWFYRISERGFEAVIALYGKTLTWVLRHQTMTLLVAVGTLVMTVVMFIKIPKGFFPIQDTGVIQGVSEAEQTISFRAMADRQQALGKVILRDPAVESISSFIGIDGTNLTLNNGRIQINLKPLEERKISASDVIRRLQPELSKVPGITLFMQPVQDLTVEDRVSRTQFQYTLEDPNADELNTFVPQMLERLQRLPELARRRERPTGQRLRVKLVFDRDTASRLGITPTTIDNTLDDAYGQRQVSTMFTQLNQYHVVLEVKPGFNNNPADLSDLFIRSNANASGGGAGVVSGGSTNTAGFGPSSASVAALTAGQTVGVTTAVGGAASSSVGFGAGPTASSQVFTNGGQVPLSAFTHVEQTSVPITVNHQGQFPVVTLSFNLAPGASLGDAVNDINRVKEDLQMPASIQGAFQGTAEAFQASLANEPMLILTALTTVYIVLGVLYESYIHPITILSTLPSAGVGALLAIQYFKTDFNVIALIGILLLIGIVKKNAILMIDFAIGAQRMEGMPALEAIHKACLLRFRPIMMTTLAALFGALPLALGNGTGSELRRPLGITIVGGLILSQALTLFTTPVIYLWFDRLARRFGMSHQLDEGLEPEMVTGD
jgi:multidrug efflux pump